MKDDLLEVYIPKNDRIKNFFELNNNDKVKVIELGLIFTENGTYQINTWDNEAWENKIKLIKEKYEFENNSLKNKINDIEKQFSDHLGNSELRQKALIHEIETTQKNKYENEIERVYKTNSELNDKINNMNENYDKKQYERIKELQEFYENKNNILQEKYEKLHNNYEEKLNASIMKNNNSTIKGYDGEEYINTQLNLLFPKGEITDTHTIPGRGDFILQNDGITMMIENKNYSKNVQKSEIDKFYRDLDNSSNNDVQCAIFVSLHSGICCKEDFEFEVRNNKPIIFLHNIKSNLCNIKLAYKFFQVILSQSSIDLTCKEIIGSFKNMATNIKRNFTKQKNKLDKYHSEQMTNICDQEMNIISLYNLINIKY